MQNSLFTIFLYKVFYIYHNLVEFRMFQLNIQFIREKFHNYYDDKYLESKMLYYMSKTLYYTRL